MPDAKVERVGASCGQHGAYVFYKAFSFNSGSGGGESSRRRVLSLGEFFFVKLWHDQEALCVGELQLLFEEGEASSLMASLRLYFLPEHMPDGRTETHGQDEVVAIQDKLTLRADDLAGIVVRGRHWHAGWLAAAAHCPSAPRATFCSTFTNSRLDLRDVLAAKRTLNDVIDPDETCVLIVNYDQYCRFRSLMKRLENVNPRAYSHRLVKSVGGFTIPSRNTRLLYCRDTFEYPELECLDYISNHLAPKMRGRTRKEARRMGTTGSGSDSETEIIAFKPVQPRKTIQLGGRKPLMVPGLTPTSRLNGSQQHQPRHPLPHPHPQQQRRGPTQPTRSVKWGEHDFLRHLYTFMKQRGTPINRLPSSGFSQLNLYKFYRRVQELGGYSAVSSRRLWKMVHDNVGGKSSNATAATTTRRTYERLCLAFERFDRGMHGMSAVTSQSPLRPGVPPAQLQHRGHATMSALQRHQLQQQQQRHQLQHQQRHQLPVNGGGSSTLQMLARARPSITITALPQPRARLAAPVAGYTALQRLASAARQQQQLHQQTGLLQQRRRPAGVELIDLTDGGSAPAPAAPLPQPTRIGSITITPVGKSTSSPAPAALPPSGQAASARAGLDQLLALHMASTQLPAQAQLLQYMGGASAASGSREQGQRLQEQLAMQTIMAQRMSMSGLTPEQTQANVEAYQRLIARGLHKV